MKTAKTILFITFLLLVGMAFLVERRRQDVMLASRAFMQNLGAFGA